MSSITKIMGLYRHIHTLFRAEIRGLFRAEIRGLFRAEIRSLFRAEIRISFMCISPLVLAHIISVVHWSCWSS